MIKINLKFGGFMIKNQKGVTISMLAVTIIVLSIMAGITISVGTN